MMKPCVDHEGTEYPSVRAMCERWHVNVGTYCMRVSRGWSLAEALCEPARNRNPGRPVRCVDHMGDEWPSAKAMCEAWGVPVRTYLMRRSFGWDLERALTTSVQHVTTVPGS